MTVQELIAHLQTFEQNAVVVVPSADEYGDYETIVMVEAKDVEARGKYVILFDNMPYSEEDIDDTLA